MSINTVGIDLAKNVFAENKWGQNKWGQTTIYISLPPITAGSVPAFLPEINMPN
jgi:hypothetical protein